MANATSLRDVISRDESGLLSDWTRHQLASRSLRRDLINDAELADQSRRFLAALKSAFDRGADNTDCADRGARTGHENASRAGIFRGGRSRVGRQSSSTIA